jgi:predicted transcriptional regulator of viral defense system
MKLEIITKMTLSTKEIDLLSRLEFEGKEVYTREEINFFCGNKQKSAYLIKKLLEKKRFRKIVKNVYFFIPIKAPGGRWAGNEYVIAKALARRANYYIGYSSVFNSYGFTDQVAQMIHIVNDKYSLKKDFGGIRYKLIKVLSDRLYGLETRRIGKEDIVFVSKERALIDAFDFYGVKKGLDILTEQLSKMDVPVLVDYIARYPVCAIRRRMGYFLERLGAPQKLLSKIDVGIKGYSFLYDTEAKKGKIDKRWRIIVNG